MALALLLLVSCGSPATPTGTPAATAPVQIVPIVATPAATATATRAPRPNLVRANLPGDVTTLDPAIASDPSSLAVIEQVFVPLVRLDEVTNEPRPGIATTWTISADGKTITFKLRGDVPWVKYDAAKQQIVQAQSCPDKNKQTKARLVTAKDFEYGILRALKPATASPFAPLLAPYLDGASAYLNAETADTTKVGVKALDDATLEIKLREPIAFASVLLGLSATSATPRWLIDGDACTPRVGDKWSDLANLQTYGPFVVKTWTRGANLTLTKNAFWFGDATTPAPALEQVTFTFLDDAAVMNRFERGELDAATVPSAEFERVKSDATLAKLLTTSPNQCTYYFGFNTRAQVVNDARVRRALSLALDRKTLVENGVKNGQTPAGWFTLPGINGASKADANLGVKFDATEAKRVLGDYLTEKNLSAENLDLTLAYNTMPGNQKIAHAAQEMWKNNLGITVKLAAQEWDALNKAIKSKNAPQVWRFGWCMEYPDAHNFMRDVVAAGGSVNPTSGNAPAGGLNWRNERYEDAIKRAAIEKDNAKRVELYAQAEKILVNEDAVLLPVYWYARGVVTQPWVKRTFAFNGRERYERWQILP
ncbi:MAG: peptide ABC transporter substrate-binding protein [Chloroflexi bacterium]|nr:peptide ABC transporter substrate-binding protein [Chloroflexota bacterium]